MKKTATVSTRCRTMATVVSTKPVRPDHKGMKRRIDTLLVRRTTSGRDGEQGADARSAQPQTAPHHDAEIDAEQCVAEQRAADPEKTRHRAAEKTRQQHRAEKGGAGQE